MRRLVICNVGQQAAIGDVELFSQRLVRFEIDIESATIVKKILLDIGGMFWFKFQKREQFLLAILPPSLLISNEGIEDSLHALFRETIQLWQFVDERLVQGHVSKSGVLCLLVDLFLALKRLLVPQVRRNALLSLVHELLRSGIHAPQLLERHVDALLYCLFLERESAQ